MFISVFIVFLTLSFILVGLGLFRPEHTELSIIGFVFIFLLSLLVLNEQLTIKTGTNTTSYFNYTTNANNITLLSSSYEAVTDYHTPVELDSNLSHIVGFWLAVGAVIGFVGILVSIRHSRGFK